MVMGVWQSGACMRNSPFCAIHLNQQKRSLGRRHLAPIWNAAASGPVARPNAVIAMDGDMDEAKVETKVSSTALDVAPALAAPVPAPDPAGISTSDLFSKPPNSVESDDDIEIVELPEVSELVSL